MTKWNAFFHKTSLFALFNKENGVLLSFWQMPKQLFSNQKVNRRCDFDITLLTLYQQDREPLPLCY